MKIRNEGSNQIVFNGGVALCNRTIEVDDKIGKALVQSYSFIREIEDSKPVEVPVEAPKAKKGKNLHSKGAN